MSFCATKNVVVGHAATGVGDFAGRRAHPAQDVLVSNDDGAFLVVSRVGMD